MTRCVSLYKILAGQGRLHTWEAEWWGECSWHHGGIGEGLAFSGVGGGDGVND